MTNLPHNSDRWPPPAPRLTAGPAAAVGVMLATVVVAAVTAVLAVLGA